jgi:hypothetical protein
MPLIETIDVQEKNSNDSNQEDQEDLEDQENEESSDENVGGEEEVIMNSVREVLDEIFSRLDM